MSLIKTLCLLLLVMTSLIVLVVAAYMQLPKFGKHPSGERLARIMQSPNYQDGQFQNLSPTEPLTTDKSYLQLAYQFFIKKVNDLSPSQAIPSIKTDLSALSDDDVLVWLGHSAYFLRLDGKTFLIDPTLISASPLAWTNQPFAGSDVYQPSDLPKIDYLIITHDHWDHLDYETMMALKPKIGKVVTALGVGAHFEHWGFAPQQIIELDWQDKFSENGLTITALPARHFSGRGFIRNKTLWSSFMLESSKTIYIGGDSGYDDFYQEIGRAFPKIDLAILENGQYNDDWKNIHIHPHELPKAIQALGADRVLSVHHAKYALSNHAWYEPLDRLYHYAQTQNFQLLTPKIGEVVNLTDTNQRFERWWK